MTAVRLTTSRLLLREWRQDDLEPFAALNADPEVMRWFPSTRSRAETEEMVARVGAELVERGWGLWALEERASGRFIGFTGLAAPSFAAPFTPAVEVGWRLARDAWGHGYASEAGRAALQHAFGAVGLDEVVSFTARGNARSRAVMVRLGMGHDPVDDFDHPLLPVGHPLRPHVLYRIRRP